MVYYLWEKGNFMNIYISMVREIKLKFLVLHPRREFIFRVNDNLFVTFRQLISL